MRVYPLIKRLKPEELASFELKDKDELKEYIEDYIDYPNNPDEKLKYLSILFIALSVPFILIVFRILIFDTEVFIVLRLLISLFLAIIPSLFLYVGIKCLNFYKESLTYSELLSKGEYKVVLTEVSDKEVEGEVNSEDEESGDYYFYINNIKIKTNHNRYSYYMPKDSILLFIINRTIVGEIKID